MTTEAHLPIVHRFAGGTLDRVAHLRRDPAWIAAAWSRSSARVAPLWRGQCLIGPDQRGTILLEAPEVAPLARSAGGPAWAMLGLAPESGDAVFALDLSAAEQPEALLPAAGGAFMELRAAAAILPGPQAAMLAYGRALLDWRRRARFCGLCGAPTTPEEAGHVAACTACDGRIFPRTDPTVIMLVTHRGDDGQERALLGHNARFPTRKFYSALAGFVEPGESLEEAVAREVMEEAGVAVGAVRYHSSQPWPFPANLMLGFRAEALDGAIRADQDELLDARWFSRAELADPEVSGIELPPTTSIARQLIAQFLAERA